MLMGESLPGSDVAAGSRLQTQTHALGWSIDDLLATSEPGKDKRHQVAISRKSSAQVTTAGLPKDFVLSALERQQDTKRSGSIEVPIEETMSNVGDEQLIEFVRHLEAN
jgi:hypothetical protein